MSISNVSLGLEAQDFPFNSENVFMLNTKIVDQLPLVRQGSRWCLRGFIVVLWACFCVYGFYFSVQYANTPGASASWTQDWPMASQLPFDSKKFNLVVFFHPECSCSKATLNQLKEVMASAGPEYTRYLAVFLIPPAMKEEWQGASLLEAAKQTKNLDFYIDDRQEFKRFGVKTSGQAFLFGPSKALLFSGGLTVARGHIGPNLGQTLVNSLLTINKNNLTNNISTAPTFGCPTEEKTL